MYKEKTFSFKHLIFGRVENYSESNFPSWLTGKEHKWFFEVHILTLEIGETIETDFHLITRLT